MTNPGQPEKVSFLIVDDDENILAFMQRALSAKFPECVVLTAENGDDGLKLARNGKPDVIVLDVNLPGINGFEVCKQLKADEITSRIPVVMVSGDRTEMESRVLGLEIGADGYLFKPYLIDELVAHMKVMLRIKKAEDLLRSQKEMLQQAFNEQTIELKKNKEALEHKVDELEEIVKRQTEELIRADRLASAGIMATGLAHEVNNPNTFIASNLLTFKLFWESVEKIFAEYAETFASEHREKIGFIREEMPGLIKGIEEGSRRIGAIVHGMKSYASESSQQQRRVDMKKVVSDALRLVADQLRPDIVVENNLAESMPPVLGSEQLLVQVFVNLLLNAANAIRESSDNGVIRVFGERNGLNVEVSVSDTGPGIRPKDMKELFSPFFTTRREVGGTGLGLFVCHGIIKGHNGKINVETSSAGTTFTVVIPVLNDRH